MPYGPLQLGTLQLKSNVLLAPLCGCSNLPTRVLARESGAGLVFPEMAKGEAVVRLNKRTLHLLHFEEEERPVGIQICGGDPSIMAETTKHVTELEPDLIDINMGCPVKKIVNTEAGCALLKDPSKAEKVIAAVVKATHLPVTVKMRAGWDECSVKHLELARAVENAGAVAVTLHARTRSQFFSGVARWEWIREVKDEVSIRVIGNGDIKCAQDVKAMMLQTGCDGVMIGRAALGNPWIFQQAKDFCESGKLPAAPSPDMIMNALLRHFELMIKVEGTRKGMMDMRRHASWYVKGITGAAQIRKAFHGMKTAEEFYRIADDLKALMNTETLEYDVA